MLTSDVAEAPVRSFAADRALLAGVLAEVVGRAEGPRALELHDEAVTLARAAREGDGSAAERLAALVGRLGAGDAEILVRSLTRWFQLMNLAEDNERIRRVQAREAREAPVPRAGSLRDAVQSLLADGTGAPELAALLRRAEVRLVLTAHPTEARRRTTLEKLARVFGVLRDLDERAGVPAPRRRPAGACWRRCRSCGARTSCAPCRPRCWTRSAAAWRSSPCSPRPSRRCIATSRRRSPRPTPARTCACRRC
jgi:phosphoenolpyruvate carboxylase